MTETHGRPDAPDAPGAGGDRFDLDYRFTLANERTFLAWLRTALGLLAGAVALVHVVPDADPDGAERAVALALAVTGTLVCASSVRRWRRVQDAMTRGENLPHSWAPVALGLALAGIGVAVLVLVAR
jgi:putative membrane protein